MPNGLFSLIDHLSVDTAQDTLGVYTCPSGKASAHIKVMQRKAQEWIDQAKEGHKRRQDIWFLL